MTVPIDPVGIVLAPIRIVNGLVSSGSEAMNIGSRSSVLSNAHHFELKAFTDAGTPAECQVPQGELEPPAHLQVGRDGQRAFATRITYTRHCRVSGARKVRCRVVLRLVGSIVLYTLAGDGRHRPLRTPLGPIAGFQNVGLTLAPTGGQNPFNKFNEDSRLTFQAEIVRGEFPLRMRINWDASALAFAPAGLPIAKTKARNGFFELDINGHVTAGDASTEKYFVFEPLTLPRRLNGSDWAEEGERDARRTVRDDVQRRSERATERKPAVKQRIQPPPGHAGSRWRHPFRRK